MTLYRRGKSWGYRFWHRRHLYKREGYPTKRRARDTEWERRRQIGAVGPRHQAPTIAFAEAIDRYLETIVPSHRGARNERHTFRLVKARLGTRPLAAITADDLDAYKQWRLRHPSGQQRPITGATMNRDLTALSAFFTWAQRAGLTAGTNPASARAVKRLPEPWRPWVILTPQQEARLWRLLPVRQRAKAQLLKHLGVRAGVVLNLTWQQIDWAHRLAHYTSKGKSAVIPLNESALRILKALGPKPSGRLFAETSTTMLRRSWDHARRALGLPTLRRHDLRVTFARQLASRGVDLKTIQALLGHSTPAMTLRYIPSDLQSQRQAVALLDTVPRGTVPIGVPIKGRRLGSR